MSTTPYNLISLALQDSGVLGQGQTANAMDMNNGFVRLQQMVAGWNRKRWLIYHLLTTGVVSTGAQSYTLGPNQQFNIPRTDRLESAFLRQTNSGLPVDYPLEILQSMEDYNRIRLKTLVSFSGGIFYDSGWPTGILYPWPIPLASIYSVFITTKAELPTFTALNQDIDMPPEYEQCILFNLMVRYRIAYRLPADPQIIGLAKDSLNILRTANAQIPRLVMPQALIYNTGNYNIIGDTPN
jgi:hypothetical protein